MSIHKLTAAAGYDYLTRQVAALDATEKGHSGLRRPQADDPAGQRSRRGFSTSGSTLDGPPYGPGSAAIRGRTGNEQLARIRAVVPRIRCY
jgi:hypothetical protein